MRTSISGKAMLTYGAVFLFIIASSFWLSYTGTVGQLEKDLREANLALLKQVDSKLETVFRQAEKDLLGLTGGLEFVYFMRDSYIDEGQKYANYFALTTKLKDMMNSNPQYASIFAYSNVSGDLMTEQAYIKRANSENNWLSQYVDMPDYYKWLPTHKVWNGQENQNVVTFVRTYPSVSSPGYRKGMMAVNIREELLFQIIEEVYDNEHSGHLFILDQDGNVVTHNDKSQLYRNLGGYPYVQRLLSDKGSGAFNVRLEGDSQSVFYRTSGYTGWTLVNIMQESKVMAPIKFTRNLLLAFAAAMLALAFVSLFYVNRRTFRPLDRLAGKLSRSYSGAGGGSQEDGKLDMSYLENVFDQMVLDREHLEKHVRDSKPMLKWKIMMELLTGSRTDYESVRHHLEFVGAKLYPSRFVVCTAEIHKEEPLPPKDEALYTYVFCNVAEELCSNEHAGTAIELGGGRAALLISFAEGDGEQNHLRALAIMELVIDVMSRQFGLSVAVGVGRCRERMGDIPLSYDESQKALRHKMIFGRHSVISIEDILPPDRQDYYRLTRMTEPILEAMRQTDTARINWHLSEMFREAVDSNLPPELMRQLCYDLLMKSLQAVSLLGMEPEETLEPLEEVYEGIVRCDNWQSAEQIMAQVLEKLSGLIAGKRSHRGRNETIEKMLGYIREHYREPDLSLDRLAGQFALTAPYTSKLFKDYTECNFIDYLIEIRIEAAKELLRNRSIKVNDVSEAVGYTNPRSFLRTFKKYTGLTPTEYRERMESREEEL
ncbi:MAG: hypothetical protein K0R57_6465 [Paenibacillaceae bacterium]|jgi:AraC-like DNA-binding protein|nr:hypothetical protein [Paenibacillaceae bacterium]